MRRGPTEAEIRHDDLALLLLLSGLAAALRVWDAAAPLWYDEIATLVQSLRGGLTDVVTSYPSNNDHPLFSLLAKLSMLAMGEGNLAFRLPAILFGVATVPALYLLTREVAGRAEALGAALLLAVSYHHVWFSQNARGYTIMAFLTVVMVLALIRAVEGRRPAGTALAVYAVCLALAAYTHLTMVLVGIGQALGVLVWLALFGRGRAVLPLLAGLAAACAGAAALTLALYAPMLSEVIAFFAGAPPETAEAAPPATDAARAIATPLWAVMAALREASAALGGWVALGAAALLAAIGGLGFLIRRTLLALVFGMPVLVLLGALVFLEHPVRPRFFFYISGFMVMTVAHGLWLTVRAGASALGRPGWTAPAFGMLVAGLAALSLSGTARNYDGPKQDYRRAAELAAALRTGMPVHVHGKTVRLPLNDHLGLGLEEIADLAGFEAAMGREHPFALVTSFEQYIEVGRPALWAAMMRDCREEARIPATVAGGDIVIRICGES